MEDEPGDIPCRIPFKLHRHSSPFEGVLGAGHDLGGMHAQPHDQLPLHHIQEGMGIQLFAEIDPLERHGLAR
jgi:hypothetical protein